jgi:hypothetical protein
MILPTVVVTKPTLAIQRSSSSKPEMVQRFNETLLHPSSDNGSSKLKPLALADSRLNSQAVSRSNPLAKLACFEPSGVDISVVLPGTFDAAQLEDYGPPPRYLGCHQEYEENVPLSIVAADIRIKAPTPGILVGSVTITKAIQQHTVHPKFTVRNPSVSDHC